MRIFVFLVVLAFLHIGSCALANQTQLWFDHQLVDHSNTASNRTWSQRYWVNDQYFNPKNGSVILYYYGEATCPGISEGGLPLTLGEKLNSLVVYIEHRFYGESLPFGEDSLLLQNLQFLNTDQALKDVAYFITYIKEHNLLGVQEYIPWLIIGGSYSGALAAWFRLKYPELVIGALGASASVNPIVNFTAFDEQIRTSALQHSERCAESIHNLNFWVEKQMSSPFGALQIKEQFGAKHLSNGEFLDFFGDLFGGVLDNDDRGYLCDQVLGSNNVYLQYAATVKYAYDIQASVEFYSSYALRNVIYDHSQYEGNRQWTWQYCTEFGYFLTCSSPKTGQRGSLVNVDTYTKHCEDTFYQGIFPNTERLKAQYGDLQQKATNVVLTYVVGDPWRWAGLQDSTGNVQSYIIDCNNCGHVADLHAPTDTDSPSLKETRTKILEHFSNWIGEYYSSLNIEAQATTFS